jgi:hypothetical protein
MEAELAALTRVYGFQEKTGGVFRHHDPFCLLV